MHAVARVYSPLRNAALFSAPPPRPSEMAPCRVLSFLLLPLPGVPMTARSLLPVLSCLLLLSAVLWGPPLTPRLSHFLSGPCPSRAANMCARIIILCACGGCGATGPGGHSGREMCAPTFAPQPPPLPARSCGPPLCAPGVTPIYFPGREGACLRREDGAGRAQILFFGLFHFAQTGVLATARPRGGARSSHAGTSTGNFPTVLSLVPSPSTPLGPAGEAGPFGRAPRSKPGT